MKTDIGHPYAAEDPLLQIGSAGIQILEPFVRMIGHGVDGEIPAAKILRQAVGKTDLVRMAVVGIAAVHPEGGDLHRLGLGQHR